MQDCSNSSALALELLQSFTKPAVSPFYAGVPLYCINVKIPDKWHTVPGWYSWWPQDDAMAITNVGVGKVTNEADSFLGT